MAMVVESTGCTDLLDGGAHRCDNGQTQHENTWSRLKLQVNMDGGGEYRAAKETRRKGSP